MRRLVAALVVLVAAWLGGAPIATAAIPSAAVAVYTYDGHHVAAVWTYSTTKRGPPEAYDHAITFDAVDRWSHGVSARPEGPTPPATYDYNVPAPLVQAVGVAPTAEGQARRSDGESSSIPATGVAANTAGSIRGVNPLGGGMNCVNCAVATDATLAGSPASALLSGPKPISVLERIYGGSFKPVSGQTEIAGILSEAGNGARGIVYGSRSGGVGHVFNGVNQGGTIRFLDGQTGGAASFSGFDSFMFLGTN